MSTTISSLLSLAALLLAGAAFALATLANRRLVRRTGNARPAGVQEQLGAALAELRGRVDELAAAAQDLREPPDPGAAEVPLGGSAPAEDPTALRHVAVVRYDAFADVGGRLSYSLAVLDDTRSGFVLTALAGKSEVRTYVRTVSGGGDGTLTAEEQQAIEAALPGAGSRP